MKNQKEFNKRASSSDTAYSSSYKYTERQGHLWSNSSSSKEICISFVPWLHNSCERGGVSKRTSSQLQEFALREKE